MNAMRTRWAGLVALALAALLAMTGCETVPQVQNAGSISTTEYDKEGKPIKATEQRSDYAAYLKSFEGAALSAKLVEMDCGAAECSFKGKLTIYAPANGGSRAQPQPPTPVDTRSGWERGFDRFFTAVERIAPWGFGYGTLREAFKAASSPVNTTTNTSVSASGDGAAAASGGNAAGSFAAPTTSTVTTTTTSTTNSHNGGAGAAGGAGGSTTTGDGGAGAAGGAGGAGG